jgi:HAD superfamily hydrolase (TIGR01509 family)
VLFDLDGTLYAQGPLRFVMACEMALVCGATVLGDGRRVPGTVRAFRSCRERLRALEPNGEPLARRQYSLAAERLRRPPAMVEHIVEDWMYRRPLKWLLFCRRPGVVTLLDELDRRGIAKGVFSDYPAGDKLAALGLAGRFDVVMSAVDSGIDAFKPDPRGYLAAARALGVPPAAVLYVGDRPEVDARGAAAAGMPSVVIGRPGWHDAAVRVVRDFRELQGVITGDF